MQPMITSLPEPMSTDADAGLTIQPYGALLVADAEARRVLQASRNLSVLLGMVPDDAMDRPLEQVIGARLTHRLRLELQGETRLTAPLTFSRWVGGRNQRLQLMAHRYGERVMLELEPLTGSGRRRLLGGVNQWLTRVAGANHPDALLEVLVAGVRDMTGYPRVVVYGFDGLGHAAAVAESCHAEYPALLGQRFAADALPPHLQGCDGDFPVYYLPDAAAPAVSLTPQRDPLQGGRLEPQASPLRAPSTALRRFLDAIDVTSLLTVSMPGDAGVWGMLVCHSDTAVSLSPTRRDATHTLVQMATQRLFLLKARVEAGFLQRVRDSRDLLSEQRGQPQSPHALLEAHGREWLGLFRAAGAVLIHGRELATLGTVPSAALIDTLAERLAGEHQHVGPWHTHSLADHPMTAGLPLAPACGLLAIPLPTESGRDWLMLFRAAQDDSHSWSGMPGSARPAASPSAYPAMHAALVAWQRTVQDSSDVWERIERLAAMDLAEVLAIVASAHEIAGLNRELRQEKAALAEANRRLERLALRDPLTGAYNRYRIEQTIDAELSAAQRYARDCALLLFDVDHFKQVNDVHGHEAGDRVLIALTEAVSGALRGCDYLGRWGGEEFVIVASSTSLGEACRLAERLRALIAGLEIDGYPEHVTVSLGVAAWRPGDDRKSLVARADRAMYRAKRQGRNRVVSQADRVNEAARPGA